MECSYGLRKTYLQHLFILSLTSTVVVLEVAVPDGLELAVFLLKR